MKILTKFLYKEILKSFLLIVFILVVISIIGKLVALTDMILNKGVSPSLLPSLLLFSLPSVLIYIVPVAHLLAVLTVFTRLSLDREIIAIKTSGISIIDLTRPVLIYSIIPLTISLLLTIFIFPWGNRNLKDTIRNVLTEGLSIKERTFNDLQGVILFADRVSPSGKELSGIFISDERGTRKVILAREGDLVYDEDSRRVALLLRDGELYTQDGERVRKMDFNRYTLSLEIRGGEGQGRTNRELTFSQLLQRIREKAKKGEATAPYIIDLHKRFVLPFSILPFTFLAISLGVFDRKGSHLKGFALGLAILLLYYLLSTFSEFLGETGRINPVLAVWFSDISMTVIGAYLLHLAHRERPLSLLK